MAYSALERNFSMEEAWTGAFGRSNSEAAFQDFLRRIPSQPNLQAAANLQGLDAHFQGVGGSSVPENMFGSSAAGPHVGLPRVPSLDFLRQLAQVQQIASAGMMSMPALIKAEQHLTGTHIPLPPPVAASYGSSAPQQQQAQGERQPHHDQHAVAAAALTLNHFSKQQQQPPTYSNPQSDGTSPSSNDKDDGAAKDGRKARSSTNRMLSNRESARRSRRRKQEHLSKLEQEINVMMEEKKAWTDQAGTLEKRCKSADDENRRLKEENERLRDELQFLRSELKELHSYARRKSLYKKDDSSGSRKRPASDPAEGTEDAEGL